MVLHTTTAQVVDGHWDSGTLSPWRSGSPAPGFDGTGILAPSALATSLAEHSASQLTAAAVPFATSAAKVAQCCKHNQTGTFVKASTRKCIDVQHAEASRTSNLSRAQSTAAKQQTKAAGGSKIHWLCSSCVASLTVTLHVQRPPSLWLLLQLSIAQGRPAHVVHSKRQRLASWD